MQLQVVLHEPEIPPNTGNIIRLCANTGASLHLIEPLGFSMDHTRLRRAGLDYHDLAHVRRHSDWQSWLQQSDVADDALFLFSAKGVNSLARVRFPRRCALVFGCETRGLPPELLESVPAPQRVRIPMQPEPRSLNVANAVAVALYAAWGQHDFVGGV